jgi:serine protease DegS
MSTCPRPSWTWLTTAFAAGAGAVAAALWMQPGLVGDLAGANAPAPLRPTAPAVASYADAVARAAPAVVNIFSTKVTTERRALAFRDPFLQQQLGRFLPEQTRRKSATSLGSGVILSQDGLLLTNRHIIKGADEIRAVLPDGKDLDVRVVGLDPETDLAVLKANARDLPVIPVGRPAALRVGDVVLAIGNPYGIGQTVTMGIVSATGRSQLGIASIENFIQTDASINPGNSGGALIDAHGDVVGINTAIYSQSGGSEGVGFAIPIDLARDVMQKLVAQGRVVRGWIGIVGRTVTPQLAESFGLRAPRGVLVSTTMEDSPAEHAGLRPGDVIAKVEDKEVASTHALLEAVAEAGPGANIRLEVWRGSERIALHTTTIERPVPAEQ